MKIRSVRMALALGLLCAFGVFFACTTTPENGNRTPTNQNLNLNQNANRAGDKSAATASVCNTNEPIETRRTAVDGQLKFNIKAENGLDGYTLVKVQSVNAKEPFLRVLLGASVQTREDRIDRLNGFVDLLMGKGCVMEVYYVSRAEIEKAPLSASETDDPPAGFRWGGCDDDMEACSDGSCVPHGTCPKRRKDEPADDTNSATGSNPAANANSRANVNANANANRAP